MDKATAEKIGQEIADTLQLKKIRNGEQRGRYKTTGGTKTDVGLALTIRRIFEDNGVQVDS